MVDRHRGQRWGPGEHESVSCRTKIRYASGTAAGKAKDAMRRRHGPSDEALNVYRCRYCDGWHLGRPQKQKKLKTRRRGDSQGLVSESLAL